MKEIAIVIGALFAAVAAAAVIVVFMKPATEDEVRPAIVASSTDAVVPAHVEVLDEPAMVTAALERAVPSDILATSSVAAFPSRPGIRLVKTIAGEWEDRRAQIEDLTTRDVRAYAIGDLLPYGSLLVGISTAAADVMVGDAHLVRMYPDGRLEEVQDLSATYEPAALPIAKHPEPDADDIDNLRLAVIDLRSDDPTVVQTAIDALIAAGDPSIELLAPHIDDVVPARSAEYAFPSGSAIQMRPRVSGELVIMVLERITGQTFGDVSKEELTDEERTRIADAWRRFLH